MKQICVEVLHSLPAFGLEILFRSNLFGSMSRNFIESSNQKGSWKQFQGNHIRSIIKYPYFLIPLFMEFGILNFTWYFLATKVTKPHFVDLAIIHRFGLKVDTFFLESRTRRISSYWQRIVMYEPLVKASCSVKSVVLIFMYHYNYPLASLLSFTSHAWSFRKKLT